MEIKEKALKLPQKPGVYLMLDKSGAVIYVGKAKKLYNRVNSYFRKNSSHNAKTRVMVRQIADFDYIITDTEFEALVLENSLIKRHMPKYNILLKDDKGYPFIRLNDKEAYPRFSIASKQGNDGAKYFGPYGGRVESKRSIETVSELLRLPVCRRKFPEDIGKGRPCLNHHIGRCDAVCAGNVSEAEYRERIEHASAILSGKTDELEKTLERKMAEHAEKLEFEKAGRLRDELRSIRALATRQKIISSIMSDTDFVAVYAGEGKTVFSILHYIDGTLLESETKVIDTPVFADEGELLENFVIRYYADRGNLPREIYLQHETEYAELLREWLSERAGRRVEVHVPKRGDKARLIALAEKNAREKAESLADKEERAAKVSEDLKKILGLSETPRRIEAYDISNTSGDETVAAMVVFENGSPCRSKYRRFKIETVIGQDDPKAMRETVERRMTRYLGGDEKFSPLPDIILLDGGKTQLSAVVPMLSEMGISVPVFGMVKDDKHKTRGILTADSREVGISQSPSVFRLVSAIQEEVHRFAIEYHRKRRQKSFTKSELDAIPGVGKARREKLMRHFKSLAKIKSASKAELSEVVGKSLAEVIFNAFHKE